VSGPTTAVLAYRFGAVAVTSDVPLAGFEHCLHQPGGHAFELHLRRAGAAPAGGRQVLRFARGRGLEVRRQPGGAFVVRAGGVAACTVEPDGRTVHWHLEGREPEVDETDFVAAVVLPRALTRQGGYVLHAATILGPGGAMLLCGGSRAGKSTTTTALHHATGWPLLGDDLAVIGLERGRPVVRSCSSDVRLWDDATGLLGLGPGTRLPRHRTKARHAVANPSAGAVPVARMVQLVGGRAPALAVPAPVQRVDLVRRQLLRIDRTDLDAQTSEFDFLVAWAPAVPVVELHHARDGRRESLDDTVRRLIALAEGHPEVAERAQSARPPEHGSATIPPIRGV
jgi:hypothetical protein